MPTLPHRAIAAPPRRHRRAPAAAWLVAVVVAGGIAPASAAATACPGADDIPTAGSLAAFVATTRCLVNEQRTGAGLATLSPNPALDGAATAYSSRMVTESFFAHVAPDGENLVHRLTAAGYMPGDSDWIVGENLAWASGSLSSPARVTASWMASPGHRENILAPDYAEIGVGVALGTPTTATIGITVTTDFGSVLSTPASRPMARPQTGRLGRACASHRGRQASAGRPARRGGRQSGCRARGSSRRSGARAGAQRRSR